MAENRSLLYGVDERPPWPTTIALAVQYVLLNIGTMMLSPIIISNAVGLGKGETEYLVFATIIVSSLTTFFQIRRIGRIGSGYLMILGPSGAFLACSINAAAMGGLPLLGTMTLLSAPLEGLIAWLLRHVRKIFTPALGGTVIMLVALLLIPLTMSLWIGESGKPGYASKEYFWSGLIPFLIVLGSYLSDRKWIRLWSPILGLILGVVIAAYHGLTDFSTIHSYPLMALPESGWPGLEFNLGWRHLPLFFTFLMATLASTIETFGDTVALQTVSEGRLDKIKYDRIQGGMYVDTLGSAIAGLSGTFANTTYSTVMPVIQLTGVSSRVVGYVTAVIMGLIAFFPKIAYFFLAIPEPVMGGLGVGLMAILFGEGFKVTASAEMNTENGLVVGTGMTMGILAMSTGFFPNLMPESFRFLASDVITLGGISALILNIFFVYKVRKSRRLRVPASLDSLERLQETIERFEGDFRLDASRSYALKLAGEEVLAFLSGETSSVGDVTFRWKYHPDYVLTEITTSGELTDIDEPPEALKLQMMDEMSLKQLGLFLLAKIAMHVEHAKIDGHHYIQFRI